MFNLKCPFYGNTTDCNDECLFLRDGGCAIILAATIGDENKIKIEELSHQMINIDNKLNQIISVLNQLKK